MLRSQQQYANLFHLEAVQRWRWAWMTEILSSVKECDPAYSWNPTNVSGNRENPLEMVS